MVRSKSLQTLRRMKGYQQPLRENTQTGVIPCSSCIINFWLGTKANGLRKQTTETINSKNGSQGNKPKSGPKRFISRI